MVRLADMVSTCTWYWPGSTCGRAVPSRSPGVTASWLTGNDKCTVLAWPGSRLTRAKVTNRCGGTTTSLTGWGTYTRTTTVPGRLPVFGTVAVPSTRPFRATVALGGRPPGLN